MNLVIKKEVQAEEMAKAVRHVMVSSYLYWYLRIAGIAFILLKLVTVQDNGNSFMITGIVLLAISFILPYIFYLLNVKGTKKKLNGNSISFLYEFTDESIIINSRYANHHNKSAIPINTIKKVKTCKEGMIIRLNTKKTVILYADNQQQSQILTWIQDHNFI